ncbi:FAD-binding protein [Streptomyces sp. NPDC057638]|uniref:FAD-binding protein n=1 Tax=Streptomyces sp. NPDC057638 TaxID=3346190 RepID=UPI0036B7797C
MSGVSRREFTRNSAAVGGAALALHTLGGWGGMSYAAEPTAAAAIANNAQLVTVLPNDPRYPGLVTGANQRWVGTPDYVLVASNADQVVQAVQETLDAGLRFTVRSAGHCYEDFTSNSQVRVLIDVSAMQSVTFDNARRAFAIEPGARLGGVYQTLFQNWGVTIPGGTCPGVGVGGHVTGGGYGPLCRSHGVTVDYLEAVEVVVVDAQRQARKVLATRDILDPKRELWWGHTGGGGGNFGIVTKYWFRNRGVLSTNPADLLPKAPQELIVSEVAFSWQGMTQAAFSRLLLNFSTFFETHQNPLHPYAKLWSALKPRHRSAGEFLMSTQIDSAVPNADALLDGFLAAIVAGTGLTYRVDARKRVNWLYNVLNWPGLGGSGFEGKNRFKAKSAYMRHHFQPAHLAAFWQHMTRTDYNNPAALVEIVGYGAVANIPFPSDTAVPQRDSIMKMLFIDMWATPAEDAVNKAWVREFYRDVFAATGGVPRPDSHADGAFINYADVDLNSPVHNTSGVPWSSLYFKAGYPRLQNVKRTWDPLDIFRHTLAIRP